MCARFTVLNETPIASAIAGCVIPLSRSSTIWMRSRCAAGIFHRSAVFNCRICFLVHLTIRPPDSNSYGSGIKGLQLELTMEDPKVFTGPLTVLVTYRRLITEWQEQVCAENPVEYYKDQWIGLPKADQPDF